MSYGKISTHHLLEDAFADFTGAPYAVAISSGGMGIQAVLRAAGLKPGSRVLHQVDTCPAVPFSIINAHLTPEFVDINQESLMLDLFKMDLDQSDVSAVIATHMWGNPENLGALQAKISGRNDEVLLIEDCCLALGTKIQGRHVGTIGDAGIFSFGSTKQLQAGEGGIVTLKDENLAAELRALRHWAERTIDFGDKNYRTIGMNGRMSEFVAAVALAQLKEYPQRLASIQENVYRFSEYLQSSSLFKVHHNGLGEGDESTFSQVTLTLPRDMKIKEAKVFKDCITQELEKCGINILPGNFTPLTHFEVFKTGAYLDWTHSNAEEIDISLDFPVANSIYQNYSIGIASANFTNKRRFDLFKREFIQAESAALRK
jgi:dTDP-4-amino-4,6-dideoxygalactose transaminase